MQSLQQQQFSHSGFASRAAAQTYDYLIESLLRLLSKQLLLFYQQNMTIPTLPSDAANQLPFVDQLKKVLSQMILLERQKFSTPKYSDSSRELSLHLKIRLPPVFNPSYGSSSISNSISKVPLSEQLLEVSRIPIMQDIGNYSINGSQSVSPTAAAAAAVGHASKIPSTFSQLDQPLVNIPKSLALNSKSIPLAIPPKQPYQKSSTKIPTCSTQDMTITEEDDELNQDITQRRITSYAQNLLPLPKKNKRSVTTKRQRKRTQILNSIYSSGFDERSLTQHPSGQYALHSTRSKSNTRSVERSIQSSVPSQILNHPSQLENSQQKNITIKGTTTPTPMDKSRNHHLLSYSNTTGGTSTQFIGENRIAIGEIPYAKINGSGSIVHSEQKVEKQQSDLQTVYAVRILPFEASVKTRSQSVASIADQQNNNSAIDKMGPGSVFNTIQHETPNIQDIQSIINQRASEFQRNSSWLFDGTRTQQDRSVTVSASPNKGLINNTQIPRRVDGTSSALGGISFELQKKCAVNMHNHSSSNKENIRISEQSFSGNVMQNSSLQSKTLGNANALEEVTLPLRNRLNESQLHTPKFSDMYGSIKQQQPQQQQDPIKQPSAPSAFHRRVPKQPQSNGNSSAKRVVRGADIVDEIDEGIAARRFRKVESYIEVRKDLTSNLNEQ